MRGGRAVIVVVLVAAALVGCGGSADETGLSSGERQGLLAQIRAARTSATAGDVGGTETAIRKFRVSVARLQRTGALTAAQARTLRLGALRALASVQRDFTPPPQPTQTTTTPAPAPTPAPAEPPGKAKKKHEEKKGKKPKEKKH